MRTASARARWVWVAAGVVATTFCLSRGLSAAPAAPPPPAAAPSAPSGTGPKPVRVHDVTAFTIAGDHEGQTAEARAALAGKALEEALSEAGSTVVRVDVKDDLAVIYAGDVPIVTLYPSDAARAGHPSLRFHADSAATRIREFLRTEKRRSELAELVFSASLVVFFGLVALYVLRKIGQFGRSARHWVDEHPERLTGIHVQSVAVIGPTATRAGVLSVLVFGRWAAQLGVVYAWLIASLSLFEATRAYTERLTAFLLAPLSGLATRVATALPLLLVALVAGAFLYFVIRFVRLFFAKVARGETALPGLPAELARPTSVLLQAVIVVAGLVFAAPVVTGEPDGALARTGLVLLVALGIAVVPLLVGGAVGLVQVFWGRLPIGQYVKIGPISGRIAEVGPLDVKLLGPDGVHTHVPHLLTLVQPTRLMGAEQSTQMALIVDAGAAQREVNDILERTAEAVGVRVTVELLGLSSDGAEYRLAVSGPPDATVALGAEAVRALSNAGISLGRRAAGERAP